MDRIQAKAEKEHPLFLGPGSSSREQGITRFVVVEEPELPSTGIVLKEPSQTRRR